MIKKDTEDPDKEINDLIVELRENSNLSGIDEKVFPKRQNCNDLLQGNFGVG